MSCVSLSLSLSPSPSFSLSLTRRERRERELHEAYRKARTPEEAQQVLHRYAQRFSISEAVLERLKPKLLERSISADPTSPLASFATRLPPLPDYSDVFEPSPSDQDFCGVFGVGDGDGSGGSSRRGSGGGSNPMQYLRQQSLPAPKFTSTVEAMVTGFTPAVAAQAPERPPKAVPLLTPKPYSRVDKSTKVSMLIA